jgi:membrane fusion protein
LRRFALLATSLFSCALVYCLIYVEIPRIVKTAGYTTGSATLSKLVTQLPGVLVALAVADRTLVQAGQGVGEVTSERFTQGRSLDAAQAQLTERKLGLARLELRNIDTAERATRASIQSKIAADLSQLTNMERELALSQRRETDLERQLTRQESLLAQGFVSTEAVEQKRNELLAQQIAISGLMRTRQQLEADLSAQRQELELNASRSQTQRSTIERDIESAQQERNEHLSKRMQLIAPISGMVTQISATVGQVVRPDLPILTIVPNAEVNEVLLLVPSRSIGFVRLGQRVSVRYQAYPYEHYGRHWGVVKEIAQAALPPQEVVQQIRVEEPVYTVRVSLPNSYLEYQGKRLALTAGMVVEADVELDRLKIYQWLLEPLYRLGARV